MDSEPENRLIQAPFDEYLRIKRWSNTTLGLMLTDGPRAALAKMQGKPVGKPTKSTRQGDYTHCAIWEGETFAERFLVCDQRTKAGKEQAAEAREVGKIPIRASEYTTAMNMADAVTNAARERADDGDMSLVDLLAARGLREQSFIWTDPLTGLRLKGRADKMITEAHRLADLKTAQEWRDTNDGWVRHAWRYGYHRQAWLYCSAYEQIFGAWPRYELIVVHNEPPYEVAVYEYMRDNSELELGENECRHAMRMVLQCQESGRWIAPEERGSRPLVYPAHFYPDIELTGVEEA